MLVCHCQRISDDDIRATIEMLKARDPDAVITPRKVYQALGKNAECGGCLPLFLALLRATHHIGRDECQRPVAATSTVAG